MMEPVTLYSKQGTTATVTTQSTLLELQEAGWTLTPQAPTPVAPVVTEVTTRPKKVVPKSKQVPE